MTAISLTNDGQHTSADDCDNISSAFRPNARSICRFLSSYAVWLFSCGATCIRLEKNVSRIAARAGMTIDIAIMPRHIHLTVTDPVRDEAFTSISTIKNHPINFDLITRLSKLSWDIADGHVPLSEAQLKFDRIIATGPINANIVLLLASLANAAFCRLFGGDFTAMAIVFIATLAGFYLRQTMLARKIDIRLVFIACSFVSAVLAASDGLFSLGSTPEIAIGTSVLYLVPGIPFINSFCDMIDGHYICALSRLINAVLLTCCLSVGLCIGMLLMNVGMF